MSSNSATDSLSRLRAIAARKWPALAAVLHSPPASDERIAEVERRLGVRFPRAIEDFYRFSAMIGADRIAPILDVFTFVPFDWFDRFPASVVELWKGEGILYPPLLTDGCGTELVFAATNNATESSPIFRREYFERLQCFDSFETMLNAFTACVDKDFFPGDSNTSRRGAIEIIRRTNPRSATAWES